MNKIKIYVIFALSSLCLSACIFDDDDNNNTGSNGGNNTGGNGNNDNGGDGDNNNGSPADYMLTVKAAFIINKDSGERLKVEGFPVEGGELRIEP